MSSPSGSWIPPFLSRFPDPNPHSHDTAAASHQKGQDARDRQKKKRDPNAPAPNSIWTSRGRKQASIFAAGLVGVLWAGNLTRRSMIRRRAAVNAAIDTAATTTSTTMGQGAQVVQKMVRQQQEPAAAAAQTIATQPVRAKPSGGIISDTIQAYRNAKAQQTSPGTSIGKNADMVTNPTAQAAAEALAAADAAAAAAAEAAAQKAAAELSANGPLLAVEALFLATANVVAWGVMLVGGALWYNDVSSMADLRAVVRGGLLGDEALEQSDEQAEQEIEEMLAGLLKRGEERRRRSGSSEVQT